MVPLTGCELLVYKNLTMPPSVEQDTRGICPHGNGPRAFLPVTLSHFMTSAYAKPPAAPSPIVQLKGRKRQLVYKSCSEQLLKLASVEITKKKTICRG